MRKNRITQSIIVGLTTLVAAATWAGLENVLFNSGNIILPIIGFSILLIFLSLNWLLTKSKIILLITLFFVLISFFFCFGFKLEYFIVLLVALFFFYLASERAINEKKDRIKIEVIRVLKRGLPFVLTGLILVISTAYYFSPLILTGQNEIIIPRSLFDKIIDPVLERIEGDIPISQVANQLGINLDINVAIVSKDIKNDLYNQLNQEINKQNQVYKEYVLFGLAMGLFFALKIISIPLMWMVILLSWIIFKILVSIGAIKIQEQAVLKEVIEI